VLSLLASLTSTAVRYGDPNLFDSRWTLAAGYADSSNGKQRSFALAQPFYSLDTPWTVTVKAIQFNRTVSRYNLGNIVDQFQRREDYFEVSGGLLPGLIDGWTRRVYAGVRYGKNVFSQVPETNTPAAVLPVDRALSYPFVAIELIQGDFRKIGENDSSSATAAWIPMVDIHEFTDRFELYVDLPGLDPNQVELTLDGGVLACLMESTS
jgi:hypothetical protein